MFRKFLIGAAIAHFEVMEPDLWGDATNRESASRYRDDALNRLQLGWVACIVGPATRISSQRGNSHAHVPNRSDSTRGSPPLFRKRPFTLDWKLDPDALAAGGQILRQAIPRPVGLGFTAPPARKTDSDSNTSRCPSN